MVVASVFTWINCNNIEAFILKLVFYLTWVFYKKDIKYPYSLNSLWINIWQWSTKYVAYSKICDIQKHIGSNVHIANIVVQELLYCEKGPGVLERLKSLCDHEIIRPLLLTGAIRALSRFCGLRAILCYTQTILLSSQSSLDVEVATIITGAVQLIATFIACGLLDRLGRRKLLIVSQVCICRANPWPWDWYSTDLQFV